MEYNILENLSEWISNETSSVLGSIESNENATLANGTGNGTVDDYEYEELPLDEVLDFLRREQVKMFYGSHFYTIFVVSFVVCMFGYITNIVNVVVLAKTPMCNSINLFLFFLAVSDIIQITTQVSHIVHYFAGFKMFPHYEWVVFFIANTFFENSFIYISNWLVAVIGMWRCIVITWPLQIREICSPYRAKITIASIVFLSFLFSTPILYLYSYQQEVFRGHTFYDRDFSRVARVNDGAVLKLFWSLQQLKGLVPMIIMVAATVWLVVILYRIRRQRIKVLQKETCSSVNHRITLMLTILLVLYWLSNIPDSFMFLVQISSPDDKDLQEDYRKRTDIIRIFMLTNSSASFFIYYGLGEEFRQKFRQIFLKRILHRKKKSISDGVSESSTVRSKSFDVGHLRKASSDSTHNTHLQELNQVIALREVTL